MLPMKRRPPSSTTPPIASRVPDFGFNALTKKRIGRTTIKQYAPLIKNYRFNAIHRFIKGIDPNSHFSSWLVRRGWDQGRKITFNVFRFHGLSRFGGSPSGHVAEIEFETWNELASIAQGHALIRKYIRTGI